MKLSWLKNMVGALCVLSTPLTAMAQDGSMNGGGGGDQIVAEFVSAAGVLLQKVQFTDADRAAIQKGLKAKIVTVGVLQDNRQIPIDDQKNLIAYSWENFIQLKDTPADPKSDADSWEARYKAKAPLAHQIIHELFRASGLLDSDGKSIDEGYRLSITKYHLDHFSTFKLDTRALTAVRILQERGAKYCGDFADLASYSVWSHVDWRASRANCSAALAAEARFAYAVIRKDDDRIQDAMYQLNTAYTNFCGKMYTPGKTVADVNEKCRNEENARLEMVKAIVDGDTSALDLLQENAAEIGHLFADFHAVSTDNKGTTGQLASRWDTPEMYNDYVKGFNSLMAELVKLQSATN